MQEIDKLRQRLKNIQRNVTEYRMTVTEAKDLVKEFELLEEQLKHKPTTVEVPVRAVVNPHILDGGTF
jgi:hypothetical protein